MAILRRISLSNLAFQPPKRRLSSLNHQAPYFSSFWIKITICTLFFSLFSPAVSTGNASTTLSIYAPINIRAHSVRNLLQKPCPELDILVFARIRDLQKTVQKKTPDLILSEPFVIDTFKKFTTILQGEKNQSTKQQYVLVSQQNAIKLEAIASLKLGVLGSLPRLEMEQYIESILGVKPRIRQVAKTVDLAHLLNYQMVDTLLISERVLAELKKTTQADLKITYTGIQVGHVAVAVSDVNLAPDVQKCIQGFDKDIFTLFGVDKWHIQ